MKLSYYPRKGEIYFLSFEGSKGRAMKYRHPVLVIQHNVANRHSGVILVVPLTTNLKVAELPIGILIEPPEGGLKRKSVVHCGQIHTVDKENFTSENLAGHLSVEILHQVDQALKTSLGLR